MRRLATQIHATVVGVLVLFAVLLGAAWWHGVGMREQEELAEGVAVAAGELLPGPQRPPAELQAALDRLAPPFGVDATVYSPARERLASVGTPLPLPPGGRGPSAHWARFRGRILLSVRLADGRRLVASRPRPDLRHLVEVATAVSLLVLAVGVGAWPLVRRLTKRLEKLRLRVEDLGHGDLAARAPVEGRDEVADLARSFNRAADRIQALVEGQRRQLAFASHELRSPLARLRVALEMMAGDAALKEGASRDLRELDDLIGELLEASRLEVLGRAERGEAVDLLGLVAEEAARVEAAVEGEPAEIRGDPRLLRRLVRNLLENARRHAGGAGVEARVERTGDGARIRVADRGPGVPEAERERIFEPFYRPPGTAETGAGYGLGLALVRQIARAHGGDARCLPREGGGTVFEATLGS
ncbi:MAG TPA: HAMP domain-containing sensor histidine kinase [Vicinamibacteria bacterium]|nr:HAMP domain-containing sensor histidine kinase [Vicinamibacteria bacterium]